MELRIKPMAKSATIDNILWFQTDKTSLYWRKILFETYPFLDEKKGLHASWKNRKKYLKNTLSNHYENIKDELNKKAKIFNNHWLNHQHDVIKTFTNVFSLNCDDLFNNIQAEVSLNPICPRDISNNSFTIFYNDDKNKFFKMAIHEIIHFIWFYIWQKHFQDDKKDYEAPHLKWILSEMVIDTLITNTEISKLLSQTNYKNMAYTYFYTMKINNLPILETLSILFKKSPNITCFMEEAYQYCLDNEAVIREQML